jgi:hypothetical protein
MNRFYNDAITDLPLQFFFNDALFYESRITACYNLLKQTYYPGGNKYGG